MKILLVTDDYTIKTYLEIGQAQFKYSFLNSNQPLQDYQNNNFDIVIVDISTYEDIFLSILELNPKQKVIVISDDLNCIDKVGCEVCLQKYNKNRLLKPVSVKTLLDLIIEFDNQQCHYLQTDCFKNIQPIISDIIKSFISYEFCSEKNMICKKEKNYSHSFVLDLLEITSILDTHNTKYEIINGKDIQLIS